MVACKDCGREFERHSNLGPLPTRCDSCKVEAKRANNRRAGTHLRAAQASIPRRDAAQPRQTKPNPICECGATIVRKGDRGPWPKRCPECALLAGREKSLRWFYNRTDDRLGELRSRYPGRIGRPQTKEHIRKRAEASTHTIRNQRRICEQCGVEYTPTGSGQRYCPNHRRVRTPGERSRPHHPKIYLPGALYDQLLAKQGGKCAICGEEANGNRLAVDHNHETGEIRGLLCHQCNTGLGSFRDNPQLLKQAIAYLGEKGVITQ